MNLVPYRFRNPFTALTQDFDRFLNPAPTSDNRDLWDDEFFAPMRAMQGGIPVDISESDDEVFVRAELPGLEKDQIHVEVKDNFLTLSGEKQHRNEHKDRNAHRVESAYGRFSRTVSLPSEVVSEKANASYKNGVLEVTLPKAENAKRRAITVKVK